MAGIASAPRRNTAAAGPRGAALGKKAAERTGQLKRALSAKACTLQLSLQRLEDAAGAAIQLHWRCLEEFGRCRYLRLPSPAIHLHWAWEFQGKHVDTSQLGMFYEAKEHSTTCTCTVAVTSQKSHKQAHQKRQEPAPNSRMTFQCKEQSHTKPPVTNPGKSKPQWKVHVKNMQTKVHIHHKHDLHKNI